MRSGVDAKLSVMLVTVLLLLILLPRSASFAQNEKVDPRVFTPNSTPYGRTLGDWSGEWLKWFVSIPTENSPVNDPTGAKCTVAQSGPVWMLVGTAGGKAERTCAVPAGKVILIPNITTHCSFALNPSVKTEAELMACAKNDQDLVQKTLSTLDGKDIPNYRVRSSVFDLTYPSDNIFSTPAGPTRAASDGYWVMLAPLPPGDYELRVVGVLVDPTVTGASTFVIDSTYHLTIEEPTYDVLEQEVKLANESVSVELSSPSTVTNFNLDEEARQVSFTVSGDNITEGLVTLAVDKLLKGPYTVSMDRTPSTGFATYQNQKTGNTDMQVIYEPGTHNITITGTEVVPEFPYSILLLLSVMGAIVILRRTKFVSNGIFHRDN